MGGRLHSAGPARAASLTVILAFAAACGGADPTPVVSPTPIRTAPPATATPSPDPSAPAATAAPTDAVRPDLGTVRVALEPVASGLEAPLFLTHAGDGSGRLFVVEQGGTVRIVRDGQLAAGPFLDLRDRISAGGERGLLGLAFAPGYGAGGEDRLYVHYSNVDGDTTIAELRAAPGTDVVDPASHRIVLLERQPYGNHNGGWIGFDGSGMLLVALGDGGSGGDPQDRAEDPGALLGKLLRIDVLGTDEGYRIPSDNPFVDRDGYRPEILHLGLRNPWRTSLDAATGDLWIADVGQSNWEEINVAQAGASGLDFGWNTLEGTHCFEPSSGCDTTGKTAPVAEYPHALGCSVTGGYVYRGAAVAGLQGAYLFGDYCSGRLWAIDAGMDAQQAPVILLETGRSIGSFGQDADAELYLLDIAGGELLRIVAGG